MIGIPLDLDAGTSDIGLSAFPIARVVIGWRNRSIKVIACMQKNIHA